MLKFRQTPLAPLTQTQQAVMDRLKDGWSLNRVRRAPWLLSPTGQRAKVSYATLEALLRRNLLFVNRANNGWTIYTMRQSGQKPQRKRMARPR